MRRSLIVVLVAAAASSLLAVLVSIVVDLVPTRRSPPHLPLVWLCKLITEWPSTAPKDSLW